MLPRPLDTRGPGWILGCLGLGLLACASGPSHEYELAPGRAYSPEQRHALLIPINATNPPVEGLEKGEALVFELIQTYLEDQGVQLEIADAGAHERAAGQAMQKLRREMLSGDTAAVSRDVRYADLVPDILDGLESGADLLIVPNMVMRSAVWSGTTLRWDGVRRRTPGVGMMTMSGTGNAASLHVAIYADDGTRVFSGYGGLDVIWAINRAEEKMELIPDRLENRRYLGQGVCIAFHPFFGDEPCGYGE